ncbi:MAG: glycerol-3-phosphate dehydrogenase [Pelagibacteraceae bacterium]|nr:glycerol-3-phosphate dehydrogenase [Pelagibacteraceae bacterium]PHX89459.1 MAG: glycerol-3-phosphate dehydrogenase [Pelagibacteraceae bacterium]
MKKILIMGAGAMGSAFAFPCVENKNNVTIVGSLLENDFINSIKKNNYYHPSLNLNLPNRIKLEKFENINSILKTKLDLIVVAVSSVGIDWVGNEISKFYKNNIPIILLTKGLSIVNDQLTILSKKLEIILKNNGHKNINISSVKGPCLATGLANKMRTGTIIANKNIVEAKKIQKIIQTDYYKCEISEDIVGVEITSAIKNLYSMLIGGSQGLSNPAASKEIQEKYYSNTAATLIHRSISEMVEIVNSYSGKADTVYGLAGLGDLYVSVSGGRNSQMGKYLGQGYLYKKAKEKFMKNTTVEGAQLALEIGKKLMIKFNKKKFPLLISILECICDNKKLQINW